MAELDPIKPAADDGQPIPTPDWPAPLPDFADAPISRRLRIGGYRLQVQVSPVRRGVDHEADTDVVQIQVLYNGRPLAPADFGLDGAACLNVWSYLCNKLTEVMVDFYAPRPRATGEPNPRLGCWGPRPDLIERGLAETDCGLAAVIGLAVWTVGAKPMGDDRALVERLAEETVRALGYWILVAQQTRRAT